MEAPPPRSHATVAAPLSVYCAARLAASPLAADGSALAPAAALSSANASASASDPAPPPSVVAYAPQSVVARASAAPPRPATLTADGAGGGPRGAQAAAGDVEDGRAEPRPRDHGACHAAVPKETGVQVHAGGGVALSAGDNAFVRNEATLRRGDSERGVIAGPLSKRLLNK